MAVTVMANERPSTSTRPGTVTALPSMPPPLSSTQASHLHHPPPPPPEPESSHRASSASYNNNNNNNIPPKSPSARSRRGSFSFLRRSKSKSDEPPATTEPVPSGRRLTRRRKSLKEEPQPPIVAPAPPQLPTIIPPSSYGNRDFTGSVAPSTTTTAATAQSQSPNGAYFPPSSFAARYDPHAFHSRHRMGDNQSISTQSQRPSSPPSFDPYARTESMTNRGRYSYASSMTSNVNSPRRLRRRKDPTPFKYVPPLFLVAATMTSNFTHSTC